MEQNQRYTIEFCRDQLLLQPDCPVHVKKLQCTRDNLTGRVILQIRFVNRSGRTVESVSLHISLRNRRDEEVDRIYPLRLTGLYARAHQCFGDEKTIILPRSCDHVWVTVEQTGFSDGYNWRIKPDSKPIPICEPDRLNGRVQPVRYPEYWYCGCGMVNPPSVTACGYCSGPAPRLTVDLVDTGKPAVGFARREDEPSPAPAAAAEVEFFVEPSAMAASASDAMPQLQQPAAGAENPSVRQTGPDSSDTAPCRDALPLSAPAEQRPASEDGQTDGEKTDERTLTPASAEETEPAPAEKAEPVLEEEAEPVPAEETGPAANQPAPCPEEDRAEREAEEEFPVFQISPELEQAAMEQNRPGRAKWWLLGAVLALLAAGVAVLYYVLR